MIKIIKKRKKRLLPVLLTSFAFAVVICLEAPFEIFANNLSEFLFSLSDFLPLCIAFWLILTLIVGVPLFFIPDKAYRFAYPAITMLAFLFFLQGTYLNLGISSLPGDNMADEAPSLAAVIINAIVWLALSALAVASAFIKKRDAVKIVCVLLSVVTLGTQVINITFLALTTDGIALQRNERVVESSTEYVQKILTDDNLTTLSKSRNVIVFIVDRFDETYAEEAYDKYPNIYNELEGFTWFQDNLSLFSHTYPAITWMLTDKEYSCSVDRVSYQNEAFRGDTPLKELNDAGYTVNVFTQPYYAYSDEYYLPEYIANVVPTESIATLSLKAKIKVTGSLLKMSLYRCFPFVLKGIVGNISTGANADIVLQSRADSAYSLDLKQVYDAVTDKRFTVSGEKTFSYIHVNGCHDVSYDENWNTPTGNKAGDCSLSVLASFKIIDRYLKEMKRLGVYDNATVVITGDHGNAKKDEGNIEGPTMTALFVKPSGSKNEPLKTSMAQVCQSDLWATVFGSEGITSKKDYGTSVFDVPENLNRTRYYRWQTYLGGSLDEYVYEINGPAKDFSNWKEIDHVHYDKFLMD